MNKNITRLLPIAIPAALTLTSCGEKKADKPNVIFILMDDAGYGDFGCYGQTLTETPNIDSLARMGVIYSNMYSTAPLSSPSRCGLLTGLHSGHAQIRANDEMTARGDVWSHEAMLRDSTLEGQAPIKAGTVTLGTIMRQAGYVTGMVGKWGIGGPTSEGAPWLQGFDTYYGCICQRQAHNYYPPFLWNNGHRDYLENELVSPGTPLDPGADPYDIHSYDKYTGVQYSPDLMFEKVNKFIDDNADKPFFLMWTTPIPHSPMQAPQEWVDYYVDKFGDEEPIEGKGYYPSRYPHATYAAMISYFDEQVGGMVKELFRRGILDNTIIIITSDNGPAVNSCSSTGWFDSAHPFRSEKGWVKASLREGGIRMPFIVFTGKNVKGVSRTLRGASKDQRKSDHIGYFADIMPTLCDLTGVEYPETDGISMLPCILGNESGQQEHPYLYWEFPGGKGWLAVREGDWKGLVRKVKDGNTEMELYNLADDDREENDVAADHPEIVERMWGYIRDSHQPNANPLFNMDIQFPQK